MKKTKLIWVSLHEICLHSASAKKLTEPHPTKCTDSEHLVSHRWSNKHQHFKIMLEVFMLKKHCLLLGLY
jgi:hypothetical protein